MTILHVTDFYLPRLGGIEVQVRDLAAHTAAAGFPVHILTRTLDGPCSGEPLRSSVAGPQRLRVRQADRADLAPPVTRLPGAWRSPAALRQIETLVSQASVVHCHLSLVSPLAWYVGMRAQAHGVPVVTTMHSMSQSVPGFGILARGVFRALGPIRWTAVSAVAADVLEPIVNSDVGVLPNGIDPTFWAPATAAEPPGPITIVSVMRLAHRKRALPYLRILAGIRARVPAQIPLRAVIVGDGPQRAKVERLAARLGLDWVEIVGRLDRRDVASVLTNSHLFLAPSTMESFGIAALEARCAGLPVVAMRVGGVGEFVRDGREGVLVDSDDEMAAATTALVLDDNRRRDLRAHNCSVGTELDWPHAVERALALYAQLGVRPRRVAEAERTFTLDDQRVAS